jgi:RNA methyltransferase, TrmH family
MRTPSRSLSSAPGRASSGITTRRSSEDSPARPIITSLSNPLIRDLRALLRSAGRATERYPLEGWRLLGAAADAGVSLQVVLLTPVAASDPRWMRLRDRLHASARQITVSLDVFAALTQVESPQGVLAIAERPPAASGAALRESRALVAVLDGVQDPGNVGTILRTAAAAGATAGITVGGAADPLGPKAIRASAGAVFRLPLMHFRSADDAAEELAGAGVRVYVADPRGDRLASEVSFVRPLALVLGSEGAGPDRAWQRSGAESVRLPLAGQVESLNVAAAAAVLLYRAAGLTV